MFLGLPDPDPDPSPFLIMLLSGLKYCLQNKIFTQNFSKACRSVIRKKRRKTLESLKKGTHGVGSKCHGSKLQNYDTIDNFLKEIFTN
jgi:hypothetical protein